MDFRVQKPKKGAFSRFYGMQHGRGEKGANDKETERHRFFVVSAWYEARAASPVRQIPNQEQASSSRSLH